MQSARFRRKGFTLIELLIVVAIIAILAGIALPNFLEAQTRAKVARVQADMRTIATAVEAYAVDYSTFPHNFELGLQGLSTPTAYMNFYPWDIFKFVHPGPYHLGTGSMAGPDAWPKNMYVVVSDGPDLDDDTHFVREFPYTKKANPYDPTNGVLSDGDIYRLKADVPLRNYLSDANPDFQ